MTLCTPSPLTKPVPCCTQFLRLGTVPELSANLSLYIHNLTTDRTDFFAVTSNGSGVVIADLREFHGSPSHSYEFWITEDGAGLEDKLNITIDSTISETFALRFVDVYEGEGTHGEINQTLELV